MVNKQFAILGLGHFGEALALKLSSLDAEVIAIDSNEDKVDHIANEVTFAVRADVSDINALKAIGLKNADIAVVNITSNINSNLMGVLNCMELGIPEVYSKTNNLQHEKVLRRIGVTGVFNPERDMGETVANDLIQGNVLHHLELGDEYSIVEIPPLKSWINKSLERLDLRARYGINVIALSHDGELNISPEARDKILPGDTLTVLGENDILSEIQRQIADH